MNQIITTLIEGQPLDTRGVSNNCKEIYRGFSSPPACGKHVGSVMPLETRQTWGILETGLAVRTSLRGYPYGDIPQEWSRTPSHTGFSALLYIERENDQSQEIVRFARLYAPFFIWTYWF